MACMFLFAQPLTMATTQLARVVRYEDVSTSHLEAKVDGSPLRMSWVVVTDGDGNPQLRMRWASDC
jgi:hypothetical protein